jgi:hypothetical protein
VTDAALGADQHFSAGEFVGIPAHTGVLRHAEQVAAGGFEQHLRGERQRALRPGSVGFHRIERSSCGVKMVSMDIVVFSRSTAFKERLATSFWKLFYIIEQRSYNLIHCNPGVAQR